MFWKLGKFSGNGLACLDVAVASRTMVANGLGRFLSRGADKTLIAVTAVEWGSGPAGHLPSLLKNQGMGTGEK